VHECYRQTDRQTTDRQTGRTTTYSESLTFAKNVEYNLYGNDMRFSSSTVRYTEVDIYLILYHVYTIMHVCHTCMPSGMTYMFGDTKADGDKMNNRYTTT